MVDLVHRGTADGWTDAFPSFRPGFAPVGVLVLAVGEDADGGDAVGRDEAEFTGGELDALAVAQAYKQKYGRVYPVVSLPSASGINTLLAKREWVSKYESVILMFYSDEAGSQAVDKAAGLGGAGGVRVALLQG